MKVIFLLILSLMNLFSISKREPTCLPDDIENCKELDKNSDGCAVCQDKFFPFFNNLLCLPCDHSFYGQVGCGGKCDSTDYEDARFALCEIGGCKTGYLNINGICFPCNEEMEGCSKCTFEVQEYKTYENFTCYECESNRYNLSNGKCERCHLDHCIKCHYNDDYSDKICEQCNYGFYPSNGKCKMCKYIRIVGGICLVCSENVGDYNRNLCWCKNGYQKGKNPNPICFQCPTGCKKCENPTKCIDCYSNCEKDGNYNCICNGGGLGNHCPPNCLKCERIGSYYKCKECVYGFALNPHNNNCDSCEIINPGCRSCEYDNLNRFNCLTCKNFDYAYTEIEKDIYRCFDNTKKEDIYLYGCLRAKNETEGVNSRFTCSICKFPFFPINDKTCRTRYDLGLSPDCLKFKNLGTPDDPLYSCLKCKNYLAIVTNNSNGAKDCFQRKDNLSYCLEGYHEENNEKTQIYKCLNCVEHSTLNNYNICECDFDSFSEDTKWCYKCDDRIKGIIGCNASLGCDFINPFELDCNVCKDGFFNYTRGQCYSCHFIKDCLECHFDKKLYCDKCMAGYTFNAESKKCELYKCKEYEEVIPGCMVCKDNLKEYQKDKKCHYCNIGYFKTNEETCVYCRSTKYGGPGCNKCGYEYELETKVDNIICNDSYDKIDEEVSTEYFYNNLIYNGKHYDCKYELSESCLKCQFEDDKLKCIECSPGYYLNTEGKCISFIDKIEKIPNCNIHSFGIGGITFNFYYDSYDIREQENDKYDFNEYNDALKEDIKNSNSISTNCIKCKNGYYLKGENNCESLTIDKCNGEFIFEDFETRSKECLNLCNQKGYPLIYFKIINYSVYYDINIENDMNYSYTLDTSYDFSNYDEETLNYTKDINLCYILSDDNLKDEFHGCSHVIEIQNPHSYQCVKCQIGFIFDNSTKKCHQYFNDIEQPMSCKFKNIGDVSSPKYTCESCNDEYSQTLVTYENEVKDCIEDKTLVNCKEANADSSYIKPLYDCNFCREGYISYCSRLYQRRICQNYRENVVKRNELPVEIYEEETDYLPIDGNGLCGKNQFNPYKNKCFNCDNKNVGMMGCKGECSFSLERSSILLCESECKEEFIESSPGICEPCENINEGCNQCEYTTNYPSNYFGIKRKRRFQCKNCMDGYALSLEKKCVKCSEVGLKNCEKCIMNETKGYFICSTCSEHYFLNEAGKCQKCVIDKELLNGKCVVCDDTDQGGIENCLLCKKKQDENKLLCRECKEGFILYKERNICLNRADSGLTKFDSCLELIMEDGKYVCSRCKHEFSLLKEDGETKCIYTYLLDIQNYIYDLYYSTMNYSLEYDVIPCHETENLGTNVEPKYSCNKCYDVFEDDELNNFYFLYYYSIYMDNIEAIYGYDYYGDLSTKERHYEYLPVKVYDENIKTSYCILPIINGFKVENCLEATMKFDNKTIYQCTKCMDVAYPKYDKDLKIFYCSYNKKTKGSCLVKFCKDCINGNNYFCSSCFNNDYEVNPYTGSCVKKTKEVPAITWKDIFRLVLNGHKPINGNTLFGPLFVIERYNLQSN